MISMEQFKRGADAFFTREVFPKLPDGKRFLAAFGLALMIDDIADVPLLHTLGLVDANGMLDVDKARSAAHSALNVAPLVVDLPVIGTMTFGAPDIDKLYQLVKTA